jgi:glycosyltransferase involved in cell wall biosynthesis
VIENQIRVFADAHCFDGEYQGSRTFIKELYRQLACRKDIKLFLGARDIGRLKEIFPAGNISFVKYKSRSAFIRLLYDIPRIIKKNKIDYAHFQYITPPVKYCRYIVTIHDVIFEEYPKEFSAGYRLLKKYLFKRAALQADMITTVSSYSKKSIQRHLLKRHKEIHVVPNGVDARFFDRYDKQEAIKKIHAEFGLGKFILCVSRIEPRKNHCLLIKAFLELELYKKGYHLVFLGHQTARSTAMDRLLSRLDAVQRQSILITDAVDDAKLLEFYRAAALFVYPSKAEGFGIPPLEAAAIKIPVLCSDSSAMSEFSFFGDAHFDPEDYQTFKEKLSILIDSRPDASCLSERAEIVRNLYSWRGSADIMYRLLTQSQFLTSSTMPCP